MIRGAGFRGWYTGGGGSAAWEERGRFNVPGMVGGLCDDGGSWMFRDRVAFSRWNG